MTGKANGFEVGAGVWVHRMVIDDRCDHKGCCTSQSRGRETRYFARSAAPFVKILQDALNEFVELGAAAGETRARFQARAAELRGSAKEEARQKADNSLPSKDFALPETLEGLVDLCEEFLPRPCGCYFVETDRVLVPVPDLTYEGHDMRPLLKKECMQVS